MEAGPGVDKALFLLSRLSQDLDSLLQWESLPSTLLSLLREAGGYSSACLCLWEGERLKVAFILGDEETPLCCQNGPALLEEQPQLISAPDSKTWLVAPLITSRRKVGVMGLYRETPALSSQDLDFLAKVAPALASALEVGQMFKQASTLAYRDGLTGVANQGYCLMRLEEELALARRKNSPLSLALLDVDGLKEVNDRYGHLAGDEALKGIALVLRDNLRASDTVARYGGDEFALILPETGTGEGEVVLCRIKELIATSSFTYQGGSLPLPHTSYGLATFPQDGESPTQLLAIADRLLYSSRRKRGP